MHLDMSLMLREFTRIPTVDRPVHANPALDLARFSILDLLAGLLAHRPDEAPGHSVFGPAARSH